MPGSLFNWKNHLESQVLLNESQFTKTLEILFELIEES